MTNISINSYIKFLKNIGIYSFLQDQPNNYFNINDNKGLNKNLSTIEEIKSIDDLKSYIKNSEICNLKKTAINTVVGDGNENANIMLIGEAPGAEEDKVGKPFVGAAGILLNKMLNAIDLKREDIYITNIIPWRPPNNRTPTNDEILQCLPYVQKNIELVNPSFILLLGSTAAKSILTTTLSITKLRGMAIALVIGLFGPIGLCFYMSLMHAPLGVYRFGKKSGYLFWGICTFVVMLIIPKIHLHVWLLNLSKKWFLAVFGSPWQFMG